MKISKLTLSCAAIGALALCSAKLQGDVVNPGHPRPASTVIHLPIAEIAIPVQDLGEIGNTQSLFLITSLAEYQQMFGERAPSPDFSKEWAFFYSAGLEPHGGYDAIVEDVAYTPDVQSLVLTTQLDSPGAGCVVPQIITKPYVLVRFPKPPGDVDMVRYNHDDQVVDCTGGD